MILGTDRARRHTARAVLQRIDEGTATRLAGLAEASPAHVQHRLTDLDREWDLDRVIEVESAITALVGLALGASARRRYLLAIPALAATSVLFYAVTGLYPLLPVFRALGLRTGREIQRERYALKALRGDFADIERAGSPSAQATAQHRAGDPRQNVTH